MSFSSVLHFLVYLPVLIGFSNDPVEFGIYRFVAGLGLGGVMPNAIALMTEFSPKKLKSTLVSIMFSGYSFGGMLCCSTSDSI